MGVVAGELQSLDQAVEATLRHQVVADDVAARVVTRAAAVLHREQDTVFGQTLAECNAHHREPAIAVVVERPALLRVNDAARADQSHDRDQRDRAPSRR